MRALFGLSCTGSIGKAAHRPGASVLFAGWERVGNKAAFCWGVCEQTMHSLMLHWLALLRQICCSGIIWCRSHVQITPELKIVKTTMLHVHEGQKSVMF